ncbi:MAG TPA: hypothetical protein DDW49_11795 [Deltaproteobacteria bacterium]|nr:MAG: hypothetical protein A2048_02620 [Deltaproteobacteria bacterium GWA2_45_12]HBF14049.1 hypothetical protein [Deltaproteobacteria bacterium]
MGPLVSYIVPCYNYGRYIEQCLRSILQQTYSNIEIVVINDGSTDNSEKIILQLATLDSRIRYFTQENRGLLPTKNRGVSESKGIYFSFVDADDYVPAERTQKMVEVFEKDKDVVFVYGDACVVDEKGKPIKNFFEVYPPVNGEFSVEMFAHYCFVDFSASMFRRSAFDKTGPFWSLAPRGESQDYLKMMEVGLEGRVVCLRNTVTAFYRRHGENVTEGQIEKKVERYACLQKSLEEFIRRHPGLEQKIGEKRVLWRYARCHFMGGFYAGLAKRWDLARKEYARAFRLYPSFVNALAWISAGRGVAFLGYPLYRLVARRLY